jgi:hypothetical protein
MARLRMRMELVGDGGNLVLARRVTRLHLYFIRAAPPALTQLRQAKFFNKSGKRVSLDNFAAALGRKGVIIPYLLRNFTYSPSDLSCPFGSGVSSSLDLFRRCSLERLTSTALVGT